MDYKVKEWGTLPDGTICHLIELSHGSISLYVSDYGATFQSMFVTDSSGTQHDIILGYDTPEEYYYDQQNFGGTMGRFANRIAGACITLNGRDWHLPANEGSNTLHSGLGFNKCMWQFKVNSDSLILTLNSPHLDNGFPGNLTVTQTITITDRNSILVHYDAVSDMDTVCNFTNHSYFNFSGVKNVCNYLVSVGADYYTPVDSSNIPTGDILPVDGTMYDFRSPRRVGTDYIDINYVDTNIIEYLYYILQKQLLDFYYFTRKIDFTSSRCGLSASAWNTATWFRSAPPSVYAGKRKPHSGSPGSYSSARGQITQIRYSKTASDSHSRSLSAAFARISYLSWKI